MQPPRDPVFLARDSYRRRRLTDALRLLPVVGLLLFLSPLVGGNGYLRTTALGGMFVFLVWFGLIFATFVLVRLLAGTARSGPADLPEPDPNPPAPPRDGRGAPPGP